MNERLKQMLDFFINEYLVQVVVSNPVPPGQAVPSTQSTQQVQPTQVTQSAHLAPLVKIKLRPLALKGNLMFQAEELRGNDKKAVQAFHRNFAAAEAKEYLAAALAKGFRQAEIRSALGSGTVLVGKKGSMTVKWKQQSAMPPEAPQLWGHDRKKHYLIEVGVPVPWMVDLGVMTAAGQVVQSKYDKFRQINRFLEFIEDVLPTLKKEREITIIDFGCGKSYLTFAMYDYLQNRKGYRIRVIGLDLKQEVIDRCNQLARRYGFEQLHFYHGDIASYEGVSAVDMVVALHACDTATDYALQKAVQWGADVILSVPCCQHEWNRQMDNELLAPVLGYGLIKERMAALYTDAIRAEILEYLGYQTQILEFVEMEHTPKNLLIRAVRDGKSKGNRGKIEEILRFLQVEPTLYRLLMGG